MTDRNQPEQTVSLVSPADLAQSDNDFENPLLNRELSVNSTKNNLKLSKMGRQDQVRQSASVQLDPKEFEKLILKNIQEFENNANFRDISENS
jgi:hypothetical protein